MENLRLPNGVRGTHSATPTRPLWRVLAAFLMLTLLSACSGGTDDGDVAASDGSQGPAQTGGGDGAASGDDTLVIAVPELGTENWAPHQGTGGSERAVAYAVHERLIQTDPKTREYLPGIAEEWESNDEMTEWTFRLRDDVAFHEGPDGQDYGTLTAEDVKFSIELALRDDSRLGRSDSYRDVLDDDLENNFEIVDDHTFTMHLSEPNAIIPVLFSSAINTVAITSKAYWEEVGDEAATAHPVGTGPWKFESFESGASATLSAVQDHWRKTPEFSTLEYRIIPDEAATLAQLRTGDVDLASVPLELIPEAEQEGNLEVISIENVGVASLYLGGHYPGSEFFDEDSPWIQADDPESGRAIREAMSVAIDREAIVTDLLAGEGEPVIGPVHFVGGIEATDPEWVGDGAQMPEFDPERAQELLAEGGYPDGFDADMISFEQPGLPFSDDISQVIASQLIDVGINVNLRPVTEPEYDEMREARASQGAIFMYIQQPLADEPADRFSAFLPADSGAEFFYEPMEEYIARMRAEGDYDARMAIARELGQEMIDYVGPAIGLAAVNTQWVAGPVVGEWDYIVGLPEVNRTEYITKGE